MFDRQTDRARKVMALANIEAQRLNHEYINTGHILLGILKEGTGTGFNALRILGVDFDNIRTGIHWLARPGPDLVSMGKLPQAPCTKKAIERAIEEAKRMHHNYLGTEHLLLGILQEGDGVAARVLGRLGVEVHEARGRVVEVLDILKPRSAKCSKCGR